MAKIPQVLHEHINTAFPVHVCLVGTVLPNGYAQISPRGSMMVYDDEHFGMWERGRGTTVETLADGAKLTVFFRKPELMQLRILPVGGVARFYGVASVYRSGPVYERIWSHQSPQEQARDAEKKGYAVLIKVERAEDLFGAPLTLA